jgi:hypothetical protein
MPDPMHLYEEPVLEKKFGTEYQEKMFHAGYPD